MLNTVEQIGLKVVRITPNRYDTGVDLNSTIEIEFNSELNQGSIINNLAIIKDLDKIYNGNFSLVSKFEYVDGTVTYKDRKIVFTPKENLSTNSRYVVVLKANGIRDIKGAMLQSVYSSCFDTAEVMQQSYSITSPINGDVIVNNGKITFKVDNNSSKGIIQISKQSTFEVIAKEITFDGDNVDIEGIIFEGQYFARYKEIGSSWSNYIQFYLKDEEGLISNNDVLEEDFTFEEVNEVKLIDTYPPTDKSSVDVKTNLVMFEFEGIITKEDIDINKTSFIGYLSDEDDKEDDNNLISNNGFINTSFVVINDTEENKTYILFIPGSL